MAGIAAGPRHDRPPAREDRGLGDGLRTVTAAAPGLQVHGRRHGRPGVLRRAMRLLRGSRRSLSPVAGRATELVECFRRMGGPYMEAKWLRDVPHQGIRGAQMTCRAA